jgi:tRNA-dihydrouridine synthase C
MRLMLAPMEGVIEHNMRELLTAVGGLDRCVTEFIRICDLLMPPRVFYRYCPELHHGGQTRSGVPVYIQLLGSDAVAMAENAARAAELGAPGIDLNFGCPAKTVNRNMGGSVLLRDPERVHGIVTAVRAAVPTGTPVTAKIRLGYQDRCLLEDNVRAIAAAGADELVIHARTKRDGYRPPAYWEEISRAREWVNLPIIANGEVWSPLDARRCRETSAGNDLMLGRGILCRPDLARLILADNSGEDLPPLAWSEVLLLLRRLFELNLSHYPARYVGNPIKQWLAYLRRYYPQAGLLFERIKRLRAAAELRQLLLEAPRSVTGSSAA